MGLTAKLSTHDQEAVQELQRRLYDELTPAMRTDTSMFLRFLRARDFNINKSEEMLRNHVVWRKTNQIDRILKDYHISEVATKFLPLTFTGFDSEGSPVRYFAFGNMDSRGILKSIRKIDLIKAIICYLEADILAMKEKSEKLQKPVEQWVYIFNYENYSFANATHKLTLEALMQLFKTYESNYPERLKSAYVVNTSIYFNLMFNIVKPLLSGATLKKLVFLDKDTWKKELPKYVGADILPAFLGGNRTDPDGNPLCNTFINHGGLVPNSYFTHKSSNRLSQRPGVRKLPVSRMSTVRLPVKVSEVGSVIEWEFETQSRDIGFGLAFQDGGEGKELIPTQRVDTDVAAEVGMFQCERSGTYVLVFDNSFSWLQPKEIYCSATVVTPNGKRFPILQ